MSENAIGFIAGLLSGITKLIVGHPFDTIKVRMQTSTIHKSPLNCLKQTLKNEGFRAIYKGASPPLVGWALMDSVQMGTLTNCRLYLQQNRPNNQLTLMDHGVSGLVAGIIVSFVATPVEVLKANLQVKYDKGFKSPISMIQELIKLKGIRGLYQGLDGCLLFRSFFWLLWSSYEFYTIKFQQYGLSPSMIPFFAGGMAANTFWITSFPFDTIKNKLMTRRNDLDFKNIYTCSRYIYQHGGGIRGFYRGYVPCLLRSFPTNASAIFVFELVSKLAKESLNNKSLQ